MNSRTIYIEVAIAACRRISIFITFKMNTFFILWDVSNPSYDFQYSAWTQDAQQVGLCVKYSNQY